MAAVAAAVDAPEFVLPWLDRFYDGDDIGLLLAVAGLSEGDVGPTGLEDVEPERLERAVRRAVLDRDEAGAWPTGRPTTTPPRSATTSRR